MARRSCSPGGSPRRLESWRAASAAAWAWRWLARWRFWNSPAIWFTAVLMKVPGPNTTFAGVELGDLAADRRQLAEPLLVVGHVARQAALEPYQPSEVGGEHRARQLAAHEHQHRLVAEVLLEALGVLEALRAAVHERLGGRAGLEAQRERRSAEREQRRHGEHGQRVARHSRHQPREEVPLLTPTA